MEKLNVLFANIYDLKDKISGKLWKCCEEHELNIEFAINAHEMLDKLKEKKYHGLILGNALSNAQHYGMTILREARKMKGYELLPAVIITKHPQEFLYDMSDDINYRILIVPENELIEQKTIMKIIHEHFLGMNQ